jgi:hypothetical protein
VILALLGAAACAPSDPMPFEEIRSVSLYATATLAGGGASGVVAYSGWDGYGHSPLRVLRHDAARPDELTELGTVDLPGYGWEGLAVSGTRAVAGSGTQAVIVDFTGADLVTTTLQLGAAPTTFLAEGRWLLAAAGTGLELVDTTAPSTRFTATAPSPVTSILAMAGGFVAFTETGYLRVEPDVVSPSFVATTSADVRAFRHAFPDGAEAVAAGPARTMGKTRIVRLDLSDPSAPIVKKASELDGEYASFAWDGGDLCTLEILGVKGAGFYQGYVVHEDHAGFFGTRVPFPLWWQETETHVAAHAARLFLLHASQDGTTTDLQFTFYRIR